MKSPAAALPSSDDHAGNGKDEQCHSNACIPRGCVLRPGKVVAEKEQHQQAKLQLPDPNDNSKHRSHTEPDLHPTGHCVFRIIPEPILSFSHAAHQGVCGHSCEC